MGERTRTHATGYRGLLFGVLAAPIAWAALHMFDYIWIETACRTGILSGAYGGFTGVALVVAAATLIALAVTVLAGLVSWRRWRAVRAPGSEDDFAPSLDGAKSVDDAPPVAGEPIEARSAFLALSGVMVSALFALLILLTGLPVLFVAPCVGAP
jgi:hypothetical protein